MTMSIRNRLTRLEHRQTPTNDLCNCPKDLGLGPRIYDYREAIRPLASDGGQQEDEGEDEGVPRCPKCGRKRQAIRVISVDYYASQLSEDGSA